MSTMSLPRWAKSAGRFGLAMAGVSHGRTGVRPAPGFQTDALPAKPGAALASFQVDGRLRESAGKDLAGHVEAPGNNRRQARHRAFEVSAFEEPADRVGVRGAR